MTPTTLHLLTLPSGSILRLHLVRFTAAEFDKADFFAEGITIPSGIAGSAPMRQAEFCYGRVAASAALQDLGLAKIEVPVGAQREPVWPQGVLGSISHIDGLAGAAVAACTHLDGLGIDLERTTRGESQAALRETVLDAEELTLLKRIHGTLTLEEKVTLVFSAKESLYKAAYRTVGRLFGFDAARVQLVDDFRGTIRLVLTETLHWKFERGQICEMAFYRLDSETFITIFEARKRTFRHA